MSTGRKVCLTYNLAGDCWSSINCRQAWLGKVFENPLKRAHHYKQKLRSKKLWKQSFSPHITWHAGKQNSSQTHRAMCFKSSIPLDIPSDRDEVNPFHTTALEWDLESKLRKSTSPQRIKEGKVVVVLFA